MALTHEEIRHFRHSGYGALLVRGEGLYMGNDKTT